MATDPLAIYRDNEHISHFCQICNLPDRHKWDRIIAFREMKETDIAAHFGVHVKMIIAHRRHHIPTSLMLALSVRREAEDLQLFRLLSTNIIRMERLISTIDDEITDDDGLQHYCKDRVESLIKATETLRKNIETAGMMVALVESAKRKQQAIPSEDDALREVQAILVSKVGPHFPQDLTDAFMEGGMAFEEASRWAQLVAYPVLGKVATRLLEQN